ncbi:glutathione-specific gamma-glutamylcyclotransferase 1 isoform X2 [Gracilinanus agilis]|uniref:glutathione-specific gamma-glutamylcyclotransferase 1 isoform X2 n=1 Tax=Gracilinanus agilis TaxID=191870 RepID=UPI001CFCCDD6|nr:glutathione-specific gamma-glutamylcyclotransferase 1 isoform X2 [Gracilinanus agilis]
MKEEPPTQRTPPASPTPSLSLQPPREDSDPPALWIFGYGSLVWRPDFAYSNSRVGFVRGYSRRFWQGDTFHRGSDKMPGRVVTLLEDHEGCTWGVAYEVRGEQISENPGYLGPAPEEDIATQILACSGRSGHNLEYLLRLADFIRLCGPQAQDEHLAAIVDAVGALLPCFCPSGQTLAMA